MERKKGEYLDMDEDKRQELDQQAEEYVAGRPRATRDERRPGGGCRREPTRRPGPGRVLTGCGDRRWSDTVRDAVGPGPIGSGPRRATITACRPDLPSRGALVAAVFGGAALVAFLCAPGTVAHVGALTMTQPLAGSGPLAPPADPDTATRTPLTRTPLTRTPLTGHR